jgi:hypothetical protein
MPVINAAKFRAEAEKANKVMGVFARGMTKSSMEPILTELGNAATVNADPAKLARIQEAIFHVPFDKQLKYRAALDVLKQAGLAICGRPCDPVMEFVRFDQGPYPYVGIDGHRQDKMVTLEPGSLHHVFDFKWKSSTGNMQSLANVATREFVRFRTSQRAAPFSDAMPTDMQFYWGESPSATAGYGRDDHSIKPPRLACRFPWTAGENVAEQWYQYSTDRQTTWHNIPGAAYLLTKGVRQSNGEWVFFFRKSNWLPHNTKTYKFEAEYPLGAPLAYKPKAGQAWNRTNGRKAEIATYGRLISNG